MPDCWIFLLKRRRALSNVSFSPTRTSANPGSPPRARVLLQVAALGATGGRPSRHVLVAGPPEHSRGAQTGQSCTERPESRRIEMETEVDDDQPGATRDDEPRHLRVAPDPLVAGGRPARG